MTLAKLRHLLKTKYAEYAEIIRYLIIGILTTLVSLGTYYALTLTVLDPEDVYELQLANIISWVISVLFAYFTNRSFVFKVKDTHILSEFFKFVMSRIFTLLVDMAIMFVFVSLLHLDDKIIKLVTQVIVIVLNYILSKFLVFINPKADKKSNLKSEPKTSPLEPSNQSKE